MGRLPDFLVIGTAKAGTTALAVNLRLHPDISVGTETRDPIHGMEWHHFFRDQERFALGPEWYAAQFDTPKLILGDKATDILGYVESHARVAATLPDAKLIACLREPVARAYSHWNHFCQLHGERSETWHTTTFEETVGFVAKPQPWNHAELLWYGHYADQLEHLFRFFPRDRVLILIAERMLADMPGQYARAFEFLGADPGLVAPSAYCLANVWSYHEPINPATAARLTEYYRPHNARLFDLLGYEISEWMPGAKSHG